MIYIYILINIYLVTKQSISPLSLLFNPPNLTLVITTAPHQPAPDPPSTIFLSPNTTQPPPTLTMESLSETAWDVVISGTWLQQSLLAL